MSKRILTLVTIIILTLLAAFGRTPDFVGTWIGKTEVPNQGVDEVILVIAKTESGLAGMVSDSFGLIQKETPIAGIKIDGAKLSFQFPLADGNPIVCQMTVDQDSMTGIWTHPEGDTGKLEFVRKK